VDLKALKGVDKEVQAMIDSYKGRERCIRVEVDVLVNVPRRLLHLDLVVVVAVELLSFALGARMSSGSHDNLVLNGVIPSEVHWRNIIMLRAGGEKRGREGASERREVEWVHS